MEIGIELLSKTLTEVKRKLRNFLSKIKASMEIFTNRLWKSCGAVLIGEAREGRWIGLLGKGEQQTLKEIEIKIWRVLCYHENTEPFDYGSRRRAQQRHGGKFPKSHRSKYPKPRIKNVHTGPQGTPNTEVQKDDQTYYS